MKKIKKIHVKIGDRDLGVTDVKKLTEKAAEELLWNAIFSSIVIYQKGVTAQINLGDYTRTFKVKETFALHGFTDNKVYVTIPVTLDTLKGLGFISKIKK